MKLPRAFVTPNRHGSAADALAHWQARGLWGDPMLLSDGNIHVYGVWGLRRRKVKGKPAPITMAVQFTRDYIIYIPHLQGAGQ